MTTISKTALGVLVALCCIGAAAHATSAADVEIISRGAPRALVRRVARELRSIGINVLATGQATKSGARPPHPVRSMATARVELSAEGASLTLYSAEQRRFEKVCTLARGVDESSTLFGIRVAETVRASLFHGNPIAVAPTPQKPTPAPTTPAVPDSPARVAKTATTAPPAPSVAHARSTVPAPRLRRAALVPRLSRWSLSAGFGGASSFDGLTPDQQMAFRIAYAPRPWFEIEALLFIPVAPSDEGAEMNELGIRLWTAFAGLGMRLMTASPGDVVRFSAGAGAGATVSPYVVKTVDYYYDVEESFGSSPEPRLCGYAAAGLSLRLFWKVRARMDALLGVNSGRLVFHQQHQEVGSFGVPWVHLSAALELSI